MALGDVNRFTWTWLPLTNPARAKQVSKEVVTWNWLLEISWSVVWLPVSPADQMTSVRLANLFGN